MDKADSQPLISVIVPVYNTAEYLGRCIDSILAQTYCKLEILLINDGSTDSSDAICNEYAQQDSRVKVIHKENGGVSSARNVGLDIAQGEWIGFVDSDDWIEPTMYKNLLEAVVEAKKHISVCGYVKLHLGGWYEVQNDNNIPSILSPNETLGYVLHPDCFEGFLCNKLFCRTLFMCETGSIYKLDESLHFCEDLLFVIHAILRSNGATYVPDALYHYCLREQSAMSLLNEKRETELIARQHIVSLMKDVNPEYARQACLSYADSAISMLYMAGYQGVYRKGLIPFLRKESLRYGARYFFSKNIKTKMKFRAMLIIIFPLLSAMIWQWARRRFGITWYSSQVSKTKN